MSADLRGAGESIAGRAMARMQVAIVVTTSIATSDPTPCDEPEAFGAMLEAMLQGTPLPVY